MDDLLSIAVNNAVAATVLALAALAIGAVYRRPAMVHGLWLLVLLKLVTPPLVFLPIVWPTVAEEPLEVAAVREEPPIASLPAAEERTAPVVELTSGERGRVSAPRASRPLDREESFSVDALEAPTQPRSPDDALGTLTQPRAPDDALEALTQPRSPSLWPQLLRIVWAFGALFWFLLAMDRLHHFRRLLRFARPAPAALQERTRRLALSLGLRRCPRVRLLPGRIAPMLWAIGGPPRLLVPAELLNVLSDDQLDTLLLHELAHLRRRDHWVRVLEFVVMGLYWWHPVVWFARRELREAEEQCCDAWVVSTLPGAGRTYASALLDTLDFLSTAQAAVPPLASGLSQIADLKRRLTMIMQANTPRSLTWPGCLAVIALGLALLPMMPSLHGEPPQDEEARKSIEEAEKALDQAKAALEKQKTVLARKMQELELAKQRKAAAAPEAELRSDDSGRLHARIQKKTTYRIEIAIPEGADIDRKDLVERIRKALPKELRSWVVVRPVTETYQFRLDRGELPAGKPPQNTPSPRPQLPRITAPSTQPRGTLPPRRVIELPSRSSEKRINELEEKLDQVIRELQELRKQMKQSRGRPVPSAPPTPPPGTSYAPPAAPAPPTPPAPPANPYRPVSPRPARPGAIPPAPPTPPSADRDG